MDWLLIPILIAFAGGLGYGLTKASNGGKGIGPNEHFPGGNGSTNSKKHWTEYVTNEENEEKERPRHWTESVYDDDTRDRDDEWEEEREDDWGDPY